MTFIPPYQHIDVQSTISPSAVDSQTACPLCYDVADVADQLLLLVYLQH
jgi:hypothetical protein